MKREKGFSIPQFPFYVRQAMQVVIAVSEEVVNNTKYNKPFGKHRDREIRPILLSIDSKGGNFYKETEVLFRFEGGTSVRIFLYDPAYLYGYENEEWVVTQAIVRFYELDEKYSRISNEKKEETWNAEKLAKLKNTRTWHHPHIRSRESIKNSIGVFVNGAAGEGYIDILNPELCQDGHFTLYDRVEYAVLIEGDLKRAEEEAERLLSGHLTVNAVAVFENRPTGEAYWVDKPTGNYRGSGHHPFNFYTEFAYDPEIPMDQQIAIWKAENIVKRLEEE